MSVIRISDTTLCNEKNSFSFKEKIEIARQLEKLNVDVIELPEIKNPTTDSLLIKTISSFVKDTVISVAAGIGKDSIENAAKSLSSTSKPSVRIELPVSPVGMEYTLHKKPDKMLAYIEECIKKAKSMVSCVEICMLDATRAEEEYLIKVIGAASKAGADIVSISDDAGFMTPDELASLICRINKECNIKVGLKCTDKNGLSAGCSLSAVLTGNCDMIKTAISGDTVSTEVFSGIIKDFGEKHSLSSEINYVEQNRIVSQINRIIENSNNDRSVIKVSDDNYDIHLDKYDSAETVKEASIKLGYDLSDEDINSVYEEFLRVAEKKTVGAKELDAIVAASSLQVPSKYQLVSYVINNGNIIDASAQIKIKKDDKILEGVEIGDGPIDAAFVTIDKIISHHYELDDFQIQAVTQGKEAMGSAVVRLRSNGKIYSGNGISTDIVGASIRAYLNAVNKIAYEEE